VAYVTRERAQVLDKMLPEWKTTDLGAGKLGIECPRKECGGKAVVNKRKWIKAHVHTFHDNSKLVIWGRACTYCFRASGVPEHLR
jgi:hypothetical protein